ncbi:hypothetical protein [Kordiimonas sp.]|uniref:hypothetical protein n=1 Tax=Kordiimonas sp. TaxID=1970157 RepID=UPI003A943CD1
MPKPMGLFGKDGKGVAWLPLFYVGFSFLHQKLHSYSAGRNVWRWQGDWGGCLTLLPAFRHKHDFLIKMRL